MERDWNLGLSGYQFEPQVNDESNEMNSDASSDSSTEEGPSWLPLALTTGRVKDSGWCTCGDCKPVEIDEACICCQEEMGGERIRDTECLTKLEAFTRLCLDPLVLENVLVGLHHSTGVSLSPNNRNYRYAAYKQFVWWRYGYLGARNRKVVPACATWKIRQRFPEPLGIYIPFKEI